MALSFEDSILKANTPSTMSLRRTSNYGVSAIEDEQWEYVDGYAKTVPNRYDYHDTDFSTVDSKKNISLNEGQINLTQEQNSQFIPFKLDRYWDNIDISRMNFRINYVNAEGNGHWDVPINVQRSADKIKFDWLVSEGATAIKGILKFEICAEGLINVGGIDRKYVWRTQPSKAINILESLESNGLVEPSSGWDTYISEINAKVLAAQEAVDEANRISQEISYTASNIESIVTSNVKTSIANDYYDSAKIDNLLSNKADNLDLENYYPKVSGVDLESQISAANATLLSKADSSVVTDLSDNLSNNYYTSTQTNEAIKTAVDAVDVTEQLGTLEKKISDDYYDSAEVDEKFYDKETVDSKITEAVGSVDVTSQLGELENKIAEEYYKITETYSRSEIEELVSNVDVSSQLENYYPKASGESLESEIETINTTLSLKVDSSVVTELSSEVTQIKSSVNTNIPTIGKNSEDIAKLQSAVTELQENPAAEYKTTYDSETGLFVFGKVTENEDGEEVVDPVSSHVIVGGSGGGTSTTVKIERVTANPLTVTKNDQVIIEYTFSSIDSSNEETGTGTATWKIGSSVVATSVAVQGKNSFDLTPYISVGRQKILLSITDEAGTIATKSWDLQVLDLYIESNFNDTYTYSGDVSFSYTPYGAIEKVVHFILDGEELESVTTSISGVPTSYTLPAQEHGAHLLEIYMTAMVNDEEMETNHIFKDIIWYDSSSEIPVIGTVYTDVSVMQYDSANIVYTVYDPNTETPTVELAVNGNIVSTLKLEKPTNIWAYKPTKEGDYTLTITCRDVVKTISLHVEKLSINVSPVTANLAFDFNPVGYSNSDQNRLWTNGTVSMTVSDNFDWVNGGYQLDENGDQYFCVKSGTRATIDYSLFADDPKKNGKEFKVVFRTKNIRKRDTSFLTCLHDGIGLDMKVERATIYETNGSLKANYCEDAIIEYEFNINKDSDMVIAMCYEDGTPGTPYEYKETSSFKQSTAQPITIGSDDCDVFIYRMKAYSSSLTDTDIKNNFIADARNANEMIARYNRNQIYNDNGVLISTSANGDFSVENLMKAAPDLRYIFLEVPQFTNDKDNKIDGCTVYFRYPAGTRPQDNWKCTGVRHRGQGTSSNLYGYSGRNIDLCMDRDESLFTWTNEKGETVESSTITLTDTSVPTDYLNIKVNIASSENENNARMTNRFNEYQPFLRYARKKDPKVKDTMEFYNCVVFIRETSTDPSVPHREFNDTNWHFYAIGNVGDSKKTDDTRVNNKRDPKECIIEITDADKPLSAFPTGKEGHAICSIDEWKSGNTAYDILYSNEYVYDEEGAFESFGGETYEFRYEMKNITEEQRQINIDTWRELYTFIVTSSDDEFYRDLKKYFVVDSAIYFYLFTERYTMVDNRAKNSFWHYGKVYISNEEAAILGETESSYYIIDDEQAAFADGYRWDLTFAYDMDTCLGIDNTGDYVFSYGKEDTDYYVDGDPTSDYVFRVADSVFFCRLRDLFPSEMQAMFKDREEKNAWDSGSLISQWDNAQAQFPEELWRLDYERKYYRTYLGLSIDNSIPKGIDKTFLIGKFFGRKKYARRAYETNNEIYFATKYFGNTALKDVFWVRGNVPIGGNIKPNYSLTLVPYSDMYVCVQYTSTGTPIHKKAKAGQTVYFENNSERMDFIYVYAASYIQEVGDLSRCYVGDNSFSSATRLQKLVIGSTDEGYENTFMKEVLVANNTLLEYLDLRNISGINTIIDVSGCSNLKELYAEGTNASGVIFANGGNIRLANLPAIGSISMKNLAYLTDLNISSFENLTRLTAENCSSVDVKSILEAAPNVNCVRITGIDWRLSDDSMLNELMQLTGIDGNGYDIEQSVLSGKVYVPQVKEKLLEEYNAAWPDLEITYTSMINQFVATFQNYNGEVLNVQYVTKGEMPVDPYTSGLISEPQRPSIVSHYYTYKGWDLPITSMFANMTFTALYDEILREYTIQFKSMDELLGDPIVAPYGSYVYYEGKTPTYTGMEGGYTYCLFKCWDKDGYVDGDKVINAVYDTMTYTDKYYENKDLSEMNMVELYALTTSLTKGATPKVNLSSVVEPMDSMTFTMGNDFEYEDIESRVLIEDTMEFDGTNYYDTGIELFNEDRDFVLAIDFEFGSGNNSKSTLVQCFQNDGSDGFEVMYGTSPYIVWGNDTSTNCAVGTNREMLILRHKKGEFGLHVYKSNLTEMQSEYVELTRNGISTITNASLIFGCKKTLNGDYYLYQNNAVGKIHWAKVWFTDLGDSGCRDLASYIHEKVTVLLSDTLNRNLSDVASTLNTMSFIGAHTLYTKRQMNSSYTNIGGFAASDLREWLEKRFYPGMPNQLKQLVKKVKVKAGTGGGTTDITTCDCYIYIPSARALSSDSTFSDNAPYMNEEDETISFMTGVNSNSQRIRRDVSGNAVDYWTRSPHSTSSSYFYRVSSTGTLQSVSQPNVEGGYGVVIEFSI